MRVNSGKVAPAAWGRLGDQDDQVLGVSENEARLKIEFYRTTTRRAKTRGMTCVF